MTCDKHSCDVWILCALNSARDVSRSAATCLWMAATASSELLRSGPIGSLRHFCLLGPLSFSERFDIAA